MVVMNDQWRYLFINNLLNQHFMMKLRKWKKIGEKMSIYEKTIGFTLVIQVAKKSI